MNKWPVDVIFVVSALVIALLMMYATDFLTQPVSTFPIWYWLVLLLVFVLTLLGSILHIFRQQRHSMAGAALTLAAALFFLFTLVRVIASQEWIGLTLFLAFTAAYFAIVGLVRAAMALTARA